MLGSFSLLLSSQARSRRLHVPGTKKTKARMTRRAVIRPLFFAPGAGCAAHPPFLSSRYISRLVRDANRHALCIQAATVSDEREWLSPHPLSYTASHSGGGHSIRATRRRDLSDGRASAPATRVFRVVISLSLSRRRARFPTVVRVCSGSVALLSPCLTLRPGRRREMRAPCPGWWSPISPFFTCRRRRAGAKFRLHPTRAFHDARRNSCGAFDCGRLLGRVHRGVGAYIRSYSASDKRYSSFFFFFFFASEP